MLSIITFAEGPRQSLQRLLDAAARLRPRPFEVVVVDLGGPPITPHPDVPVRVAALDDGVDTSAAAARARGAQVARGSLLVFLDVDCIPGPGLVGEMRTALFRRSGLVMANLRTLQDDVAADGDEPGRGTGHEQQQAAELHDSPSGDLDTVPPELFRPTAFGVRRNVLEELAPAASNQPSTQLAHDALGRAAARAGIPISCWRGAVVHQPHHQRARRSMAQA